MEQRFYLITGVMASGKSTTAQALAQALPRCVHLRGDLFRRMIVTGREEMAGGPLPFCGDGQGPGGFPGEEGLCGLFPRGPVAQLYAGDAPRGPLAGQLPYDGGTGCEGDPLPGGEIRPLCIDRLETGKLSPSTSERMR